MNGRGSPKFNLLTHGEGQKYIALYLSHKDHGNQSYGEVAKQIPGLTRMKLSRWKRSFENTGEFLPQKRKPRVKVFKKADLTKLKSILSSQDGGSRGQRTHRSLRKSYPRLTADKSATPVCRETCRKALKEDGWAYQPVKGIYALRPTDPARRVAFAKREARGIAANTMITDSTKLPGEQTTKSKKRKAWGPMGCPPEEAEVQYSGYGAHLYAGITKYGATKLYVAKGTTGGSTGRPVGRPKKDSIPVVAPSDTPVKRNTVDHIEYRRILGSGPKDGLLQDGRNIFGGNLWRFQQDGARAHTVADSDKGRPTRALIARFASLVEDWPPRSPDMSPIEKAWFALEHDVWANETWSDLDSFIAALHRSWARVVTPQYCASLFSGMRATYDCVIAKKGQRIRGWGKSAR